MLELGVASRGAPRRRRRAREVRERVPPAPAPRARGRPRVARGQGPGRAVGAPADPRRRPAVGRGRGRRRHAPPPPAAAPSFTPSAAPQTPQPPASDSGPPTAEIRSVPSWDQPSPPPLRLRRRRPKRGATLGGSAAAATATNDAPTGEAARPPLFPAEAGNDAEPLDDEAFFASLREAVSDQSPLGPRDDATDHRLPRRGRREVRASSAVAASRRSGLLDRDARRWRVADGDGARSRRPLPAARRLQVELAGPGPRRRSSPGGRPRPRRAGRRPGARRRSGPRSRGRSRLAVVVQQPDHLAGEALELERRRRGACRARRRTPPSSRERELLV